MNRTEDWGFSMSQEDHVHLIYRTSASIRGVICNVVSRNGLIPGVLWGNNMMKHETDCTP